ncbi:MAG TPA: ATP-binding protein [Bryobacteraceae bacterium]|nr:ATP-binding protein [Bryobacteraceae bacterium]
MAVSFADQGLAFARNLAQLLKGKGFVVVSDDPRLSSGSEAWGTHAFDRVDRMLESDVLFCIILLTADYQRQKWAGYRHCRLVEATMERKGFLLPVRIGGTSVRLRGIDLLTDLAVGENDAQVVADDLISKSSQLTALAPPPFGRHADIQTILHLHNPRLRLEQIEVYEDRAAMVGFELYEANDPLTDRATFFLHLYRGINTTHTREYIFRRYRQRLDTDPLVILLPKEPRQTKLERRLENVQEAFSAKAAYYIDQFIWEQCTFEEFRERQEPFPIPTFIDPNVRDPAGTTALASIRDWASRDNSPVLILQGSGGIGKTTVAQTFHNELIKDATRKVVFIDDKVILRYMRKHRDVLPVFDVYHAYRAYVASKETDGTPREQLGRDLFQAHFENGNITVILDGLDEVASDMGAEFDLTAFLESIYHNLDRGGYGKVLITCRTSLLHETEIDPNIYQLELLPFDTVLATHYFESRFVALPKTVDRALRTARRLMFTTRARDEFIPFVLDVVFAIVHAQVEDDDPFEIPLFDSAILLSSVDTDYVVGKVCQRERKKYEKGLTVDEQVQFFVHLAIHGSVVRVTDVGKMLAEALERRIDRSQEQAIQSHPLLRVDRDMVSFKYDLLEPYFQALCVSELIRGRAEIDRYRVDTLSSRAELDPTFATDCVMRLSDAREDLSLRLVSLIEQVNELKELREPQRRRIVSALFQLGLYRQRGTLTREAATDLLKDLFMQKGAIRGLSLANPKDRFIFNFSGLKFENCVFLGYDAFWECTFDKETFFARCVLSDLHLRGRVRTLATRENFDLHTCECDPSVQRVLVRAAERSETEQSDYASDLDRFLEMFNQRGHMKPMKEAVLKAKYRGKTSYQTLVAQLKEQGLIETHVSYKSKGIGPELAIVKAFENDAVKFCTEGAISSKIKAVIRAGRA